MIPNYVKTKEQYEVWFRQEVEEALKSPISDKTTEQLRDEYKEKYKF